MRKLPALLLALLLVTLAACSSGGDDDSSDRGDRGDRSDDTDDRSDDTDDRSDDTDDTADDQGDVASADEAGWTVLVYMVADNNLEPFGLQDLEEMAGVEAGDGVNIVALVDRSAGYADDPVGGLADFEDTKLLTVADGELVEQLDAGELDTGDPATLADFIELGVTDFPAEHYALFMWDHGAAWPGMGLDEDTGNIIDMPELVSALDDGTDRAGIDTFDLLGFDACLMASYEVASQLAPYGDLLVSSEELEPGHGWDYGALQEAADDPSISPADLGSAILDGFQAQAVQMGTEAEITLSLVDLTALPALDEALVAWTDEVGGQIDQYAGDLGRARVATLGFGKNPDPALDTWMTDLGLLVSGLGATDPALDEVSQDVIDALDDAVVASVAGPSVADATGLAIYFPQYGEYFNEEYRAVDATGWSDFLDRYYGAGQDIPASEQPVFDNTDKLGVYSFDADGLNLSGSFDLASEDNLTEAVISYGILDESDGSIIFFGDEPGVAVDGEAAATYDLTVLTMSDGIDTVNAYLSLSFDEDLTLATFDIPLAYYPPGSEEYIDVVLSVVLDIEAGSIVSETYYQVDENGVYGELTADPTGFIVPTVYNVYPDGTAEWIPTSDVPLYANLPDITYDFEPLPSGTQLYAELSVYDYGGNSDYVYMFDTIP